MTTTLPGTLKQQADRRGSPQPSTRQAFGTTATPPRVKLFNSSNETAHSQPSFQCCVTLQGSLWKRPIDLMKLFSSSSWSRCVTLQYVSQTPHLVLASSLPTAHLRKLSVYPPPEFSIDASKSEIVKAANEIQSRILLRPRTLGRREFTASYSNEYNVRTGTLLGDQLGPREDTSDEFIASLIKEIASNQHNVVYSVHVNEKKIGTLRPRQVSKITFFSTIRFASKGVGIRELSTPPQCRTCLRFAHCKVMSKPRCPLL